MVNQIFDKEICPEEHRDDDKEICPEEHRDEGSLLTPDEGCLS